MAISIGDIWQPSPGVWQLEVSLGGSVGMTLADAIELFKAVPGVKDAGAAGGMWPRGCIDLSMESDEWTSRLRADLIRACQQIVATRQEA